MFDNLGTALVQALGFFAVFGFFIYQTLFADSKPKNSKLNPKKIKISKTKELIKKEQQTSKNQLNKIINKYPYLPFILGFSLLAILIIDLVNYYK